MRADFSSSFPNSLAIMTGKLVVAPSYKCPILELEAVPIIVEWIYAGQFRILLRPRHESAFFVKQEKEITYPQMESRVGGRSSNKLDHNTEWNSTRDYISKTKNFFESIPHKPYQWTSISCLPSESSSATAAARLAGGLRADYGFVATMDREIKHDPERDVGYGITELWDEIVETLQGAPVSTDTELGRHMTAFEIYTRLDDEQSQRQLLVGRLNMLFRDRRAHAYTRHQMETEARLSREAWRRSMDANDLARGEVMSLRTTVLDERVEDSRSYPTAAAYKDIDSYAVSTEGGDSTTWTGDHLAGACDSLTRTGDHTTGTGD
ncbi:hypothetical protein Tco_0516185 [Tanacetum coccineum]